jgi:hypothetical protein
MTCLSPSPTEPATPARYRTASHGHTVSPAPGPRLRNQGNSELLAVWHCGQMVDFVWAGDNSGRDSAWNGPFFQVVCECTPAAHVTARHKAYERTLLVISDHAIQKRTDGASHDSGAWPSPSQPNMCRSRNYIVVAGFLTRSTKIHNANWLAMRPPIRCPLHRSVSRRDKPTAPVCGSRAG